MASFKGHKTLMSAETTSENNSFPNYDKIINLVAKSCEELPEELVVEILCKLSVKSLIRFKTVCKPWKLLINSHVFINKHLHRKNPQHGLCSRRECCFFPRNLQCRFIGACNGIICFTTNRIEKQLLLFNPSTREFSFLPYAFDSWNDYGFCYLSKTQEYQVIAFMKEERSNEKIIVELMILTLGKTESVRYVKDITVPGWITDSYPTTSGTCMCWLGAELGNNKNEIVIRYDAIEERFSKINVPDYPSSWKLSKCIEVFKDSVIMFVHLVHKYTFLDIWMLIDEDVSKEKSWIKYRKIDYFKIGMIWSPNNILYDRWILCCRLDNKYCCNLFYYDVETDQVEDCKVTNPPIGKRYVNYVESLVSINDLVPHIDTIIPDMYM